MQLAFNTSVLAQHESEAQRCTDILLSEVRLPFRVWRTRTLGSGSPMNPACWAECPAILQQTHLWDLVAFGQPLGIQVESTISVLSWGSVHRHAGYWTWKLYDLQSTVGNYASKVYGLPRVYALPILAAASLRWRTHADSRQMTGS